MTEKVQRVFEVIDIDDPEIQTIDLIGKAIADFDKKTAIRILKFCKDRHISKLNIQA